MTDSNKGLRILIVEDNPDDQYLITELLQASVIKIQLLSTAESLGKAIGILQKEIFDIIFLDLSLPDSSGIGTFKALIDIAGKIPIVILSGSNDMDIAVEAITLGAQDYHLKGDLDERALTKTILYSIERNRRLENSAGNNERYITVSKAELEIMKNGEITRQIMNGALDAIICTDAYGKIIVWNPQAENLFGWKGEEILGKALTETIIPPEYRERHENGMKHYTATGEGPILNKLIEITAMNSKKQRFPVELTILPLKENDNRFFCAFIRDISERKKIQEKENKNIEEHHILAELNKAVNRVQIPEEIYELTLDALQALIKVDKAAVLLFDSSNIMRFVACRNLSAKYKKEIEGHSPWTANEKDARPIFISDVSKDPGLHKLLPFINEEGIASMGFIPLIHQQQLLGKLMVYFKAEHQFTEEEIQLIQNVSNNVSFAIWEKRSAIALKESEEKYRSLIEQASDGIVVYSLDGTIYEFNQAAYLMSGYSREEFKKLTVHDLLNNEDLIINPSNVEKFKKGETVLFERRVRKKDGSVIDIEQNVRMLADGKLLAFVRDVTANKKAEATLKASEKNLQHVLSSTSDYYYVLDRNYRIVLINESAEKSISIAWGKPVTIGANILDLIPVESDEPILKSLEKVFAGNKVEYELKVSVDGLPEWVLVNYMPVMDDDGGVVGAYIVTKDISEKKKDEEQILITNARFQMLSKATSDIVWDWDMLQDTLWWNDNYYSQLGLKKEKELTDLDDWYSRIHPDDVPRVKNDLEAANKDNSVYRSHEYRYKKADGTYLNFLDRSFVMRNPDGQPYRMVGSMINMTPVYLAQKEVAESENRLRAIFETEPECIKLLGPKGELLDMNPAGLAMIEADSLDMVKGTLISSVVMPEHRDAFNRLNRDVFKGEPGKLKFEIVGLKGTHRWMETHAVPLKNADGKIISILGVSRDITESKKAEQALIEREEQYRALVENAPEALVVFDAEKRKFVSVSESAVSLFKYSRDEFLKIGPQDISPEYQPDGRLSAEAIMENISQAIAGGKPSFEWTHCDKDGKPIPCEVRLVRLPSENKILIRGSMIDITERKRAQEKLLESERFLNKSQAVSKIGSYVLNLKTGEWGSSAELDNILEFTSDDNHTIDGWASVLHPDHKKMMMEYFTEEVIGKKKRFDKEYKIIKKKSGKECWVHGIGDLEFDSSGTLVRMLGVIQDITGRKKTEELLKESEERYRTLVEQAVDAIALYDAAGKVLDVNTGCANLLGYTKEELVGMSLNEILTKEEIKSNPVRYDVLQQGVSTVKQRRMIRKDGTTVETEVRSQQLPDGRFLSVIRDLSDRLRVEKDLASSYDAIRRLTGHLQDIREDERAHIAREIHDELGQQLTVMKMDVSWLKKRIKGSDETVNEKLKELLLMLDGTVKSVRRISSELRPSLLDDLGLVAALEWQLTEFEKRSGIVTSFIYAGDEKQLPDTIKTALFRIVQESLTNVARHSGAKKVTVTFTNKDDTLFLSIADNGKGFDKQKITDKRTLGILGMKERVNMMNGVYNIKANPGKGTEVLVQIPMNNN